MIFQSTPTEALTHLLSSTRRQEASDHFNRVGLKRSEAWKYTKLGDLLNEISFEESAQPATMSTLTLPSAQGVNFIARGVTLNGALGEVEGLDRLPQGVKLMRLSEEETSPLIADVLGELAEEEGQPMCALNTARFTDGWLIYAGPETRCDQPILIDHLCGGIDTSMVAHTRVLIVADVGSQLSVIERFISEPSHRELDEGRATTLSNSVTEISLNRDAQVNYTRIQDLELDHLHIGRVATRSAGHSHLIGHFYNLGARLARVELDSTLSEPEAEVHLSGLFTGCKSQHLDQHLTLRHLAPRCLSTQRFRGALGGNSRGIFTGKVYVAPGASGTRAEQNNPNLILSQGARAMTRPQLEIYNDDVECSHGATVGQLDEQRLFYLRARGLTHEVALQMLTAAFAAEVRNLLKDISLQKSVDRAIQRTLGSGLASSVEEWSDEAWSHVADLSFS
jgi:Fe-S cluster assembly protein SufD